MFKETKKGQTHYCEACEAESVLGNTGVLLGEKFKHTCQPSKKCKKKLYDEKCYECKDMEPCLDEPSKKECDCLLSNGLLKSRCFNGTCDCKCHKSSKEEESSIKTKSVGAGLYRFVKKEEPESKCEESGQYGKDENKNLHFYCEFCGEEMDYEEDRICKARIKPESKDWEMRFDLFLLDTNVYDPDMETLNATAIKRFICSEKKKSFLEGKDIGLEYMQNYADEAFTQAKNQAKEHYELREKLVIEEVKKDIKEEIKEWAEKESKKTIAITYYDLINYLTS